MAVVAAAERAGGARGEAADLAGGGGYAGAGGGGSREREVAWRRGRRRPEAARRPWRRGGVREAESRPGGRGRAGVGLGRGLAGCWAGPVRRRVLFFCIFLKKTPANKIKTNKSKILYRHIIYQNFQKIFPTT